MMGAFKLSVDDQIRFYEIVTITEEAGSLMLRLKHFDHDLKGWEEKDETVDFPLVKLDHHKAYFDGFTFEKINENSLNIYVVTEIKGKSKEVKFANKRVKLL